jgi:hypothetical protein
MRLGPSGRGARNGNANKGMRSDAGAQFGDQAAEIRGAPNLVNARARLESGARKQ